MKAKVKSFAEIKETLDWGGRSIFSGIDFTPDMIGLCGKEVDITLDASDGVYETSDGWFFGEDWLELSKEAKEVENFKNDSDVIHVVVRATDREFAHKCLDAALDDYERKYGWTKQEKRMAQKYAAQLLEIAFQKNICPVFYEHEDTTKSVQKGVYCNASYGTYGKDGLISFAYPKGSDIFDWDIGRCVALCKILHKPVPDFIKNKNKN